MTNDGYKYGSINLFHLIWPHFQFPLYKMAHLCKIWQKYVNETKAALKIEYFYKYCKKCKITFHLL